MTLSPQRNVIAAFLVYLAISSIHFVSIAISSIEVSPPDSEPIRNAVYAPLAIRQAPAATAEPAIQAQTGIGEALNAVVPLERQTPVLQSALAGERAQSVALPAEEEIPGLRRFIAKVTNGEPETIRGVYVADVLALPVIQQPDGDAAYVSEEDGVVTQFQSAAHYQVTGLLAHNYLAGELFDGLEPGQTVFIVMGNGDTRRYRVTGVFRYQKLSPNSLRSRLIDLETNQSLSTAEVFGRFYKGEHKVTFQTCLEGEGLLNWGLVFIVAEPIFP
jgi:hypothetical protein